MLGQIGKLAQAEREVALVLHVLKPLRQNLHVAPGLAPVGMQPFIDHHQAPEGFIEGLIVRGDEPARVAAGILAAAQVEDVAGLGIPADERTQVLLLCPELVEKGGGGQHRGIQRQRHPVPASERCAGLEVVERQGLTAELR